MLSRVCLSVAVLGVPAVGFSDTVTYNSGTSPAVVDVSPAVSVDSFGPTNIGSNAYSLVNSIAMAQTISVPKFDTTLGSLSKVTLTLIGEGSSKITIEALAGAGNDITVASTRLYVDHKLLIQDDGARLTVDGSKADFSNPQFTESVTNLSPFTLTPGAKKFVNGSIAGLTTESEYTDWATLSSFKVAGLDITKTLDLTAFLNYSATWTGAQTAKISHSSSFGARAEVTYEYSAVPEATTLLLGLAGGMPLLMHRRRARAAKA